MPTANLTLTVQQRDGLILEADDFRNREDAEAEWWTPRWDMITARVVDDLLLPDAAGRYHLTGLTRQELIEFLEHAITIALGAYLEERWLQIWHTCVVLLERLDHEVAGSIYDKIDCSCERHRWERDCISRFEAEIASVEAGDVDGREVALARYRQRMTLGPLLGDIGS